MAKILTNIVTTGIVETTPSGVNESSGGNSLKIGYLIPEFPGQTHAFFWRERQALQEFNVSTQIVSTRIPQTRVSHSWAEQGRKDTTYLLPLSLQDGLNISLTILRAAPGAWWRCLRSVVEAKDLSLPQKLRQFALIPIAAKLLHVSRQQGWTHIHVHSCATSADIAMFASFLGDLTYSLTQHGPAFDTYGPNQAQKWQHAEFGTVVSDKLLEEFHQRLGENAPTRLAVVTMGVNLDDFSRQIPYQPWQKDQPCFIFSTGRLNRVKGHKDLFQVVNLLVERNIDARLKIAGEDENGGTGYHQVLDQMIQEQNLSDRVELLGAVSESRVREELERSHIFALASLNEGTSVAIMEAMAMEVPIVVTAVGGTPKLVQHNVNGILVEPENPQMMAEHIETLLNQPEFSTKLGKAARQTIADKYHHRSSAKILTDFLHKPYQSNVTGATKLSQDVDREGIQESEASYSNSQNG